MPLRQRSAHDKVIAGAAEKKKEPKKAPKKSLDESQRRGWGVNLWHIAS